MISRLPSFSKSFVMWLLSLTAIVAASLLLRSANLSSIQKIKADEQSWILSGISLLNQGSPSSWTIFWDTYRDYSFSQFDGETFATVRPYLDHPPLFSLLIGSWAQVSGNNTAQVFDWAELRWPMVITSVILIIVTALYATAVFGKRVGFLSLVSLSTLPTHILASRIIGAETPIALLLMISMLSCWQYCHAEKNGLRKNAKLAVIVLCCFAAPLLKLSGVVVPLSVVLVLWSQKKYLATLWSIVAAIAAGFTFIAYGCYHDCSLFWEILHQHSLRPQTFWYFFTLFSAPDIGNLTISDPLFVLGLLGTIVTCIQSKRTTPWLLAPLISLALIFVTVAPTALYGWYKFLILPLVGIGLGILWDELLEGKVGWLILVCPAILVLTQNVIVIPSAVRNLLVIGLFFPLVISLILPHFIKTKIYPIWVGALLFNTAVLASSWALQITRIFK